MNIRKLFTGLLFTSTVILMWAIPVHGAQKTVLDENFDSWQPGKVKGSGNQPGMSIVTDPVVSKPHAFRVAREGSFSSRSFAFTDKVPAGHDYTISFNVMLIGQSSGGLAVLDTNGNSICQLYIRGALQLLVHDTDKLYIPVTGLPDLPLNEWINFELNFNTIGKFYKVKLTDASGKVYDTEQEIMLTSQLPPSHIRISNSLPAKCVAVYDDLKLSYNTEKAVVQRKKIADISGITVESGKNKVVKTFSPSVDFGAFKVENSSAGKIKLRAQNRLGHWFEREYTLSGKNEQYLDDFPESYDIAALEVENTGNTTVSIRNLSVLSLPVLSDQARNRDFNAKLSAEYRLPVYDQQYKGNDKAEFKFINYTEKDIPVTVTVTGRKNGKTTFPERKLVIKPGYTSIYYPLKDLPNGEFITTVKRADGAYFRRLLRHNTPPPAENKPQADMTGLKMYFPDNFYLKNSKNVDFLPIVADMKLIKRDNQLDDETFVFIGDKLFLNEDGKIVVNAHSFNRRYASDSYKAYHAVALDDSMEKWDIRPGHAKIPAQITPFTGYTPEAAKPRWNKKTGPDGKIKYRWYNPAKDGKVVLAEMDAVWANPGDSSTALVGGKIDWQIVNPPRFSVWPIWYKAPGEAVIMTRKPIMVPLPGKCEFEPENGNADINFSQWLSDDGKTFFKARARHLIRYAPFQIPYDNVPHINRINAVFRTKDGVNWEQSYIAPPSTAQPVGSQHYGGKEFRVRDGGGLRVGILTDYDAEDQTFNLELMYSWDGFRWTRYQEAPRFLEAGEPMDKNSFRCGNHFPSGFVKDGKIYHLIIWACNYTHWESEFLAGYNSNIKHINADFLKKELSPRKLETWPPFHNNYGGSWEKLAQDVVTASSTAGVLTYREDGWFRMEAKDVPAEFTTVDFTAGGKMTVNAEVADNGYIKLALVEADGNVFAEKTLEQFDGINTVIFENLPAGKFHVRGQMKNAKLYTIGF